MKKEFGSHNISEHSNDELFQEARLLIPYLFSFNRSETDKQENYVKVIRLFEIIKFSKDKYPFLLTLEFKKDKSLAEVKIWEDPYFKKSNEKYTAFTGGIFSFPDLSSLSENQEKLTTTFNNLLEKPFNQNSWPNIICIAGNEDCILNIGSPHKTVFEKFLKSSLLTVTP